jgi:hypothetical protein
MDPSKLNAVNSMLEDYSIFNEAQASMQEKKKRIQPADAKAKVVNVPVDVSKVFSSLAADLKKDYDYDVEADWDIPLLQFFSEVEEYKREIGDPTEGNKKEFVQNFMNSEFYQKHLQSFMKSNPGINYKYADYVMSDMFSKIMLVGSKGILKPTGFNQDGTAKGWEIPSAKIPMTNMEYLKMVQQFGDKLGNKAKDVEDFEKTLEPPSDEGE